MPDAPDGIELDRIEPDWIEPDWPAPARVRALSTTRRGGVSRAPFDSLNLGAHVDDDPRAVAANRTALMGAAGLPGTPRWLTQVHGIGALHADSVSDGLEGDASWSATPGVVCGVLTADCLPVLLCERGGRAVAAAHGGWRGLAAGVLEATIDAMGCDPRTLMAWIGPGIGPAAFEVGEAVRDAFRASDPGCGPCFAPGRPGHWLADLGLLAERRLERAGVDSVQRASACTYSDRARFFSYRRDGQTGRMATLIWLQPGAE